MMESANKPLNKQEDDEVSLDIPDDSQKFSMNSSRSMKMSPRKWAMVVIYGLLLSFFLNILLIAIAAAKGGKKAVAETFDPFSPEALKMASPSSLLSTENI